MFEIVFYATYIVIGWWLGKKAIDVWSKGESKGIVPFLFFPVSACRGKVGEDSYTFVSDWVFVEGKLDEVNYYTYRLLLTFGWPVRLLVTVIIFGLSVCFKPSSGLAQKIKTSPVPRSPAKTTSPDEAQIDHETKAAMDDLEKLGKEFE
jgi:hypothetical protein